jgi:hypothetical protein
MLSFVVTNTFAQHSGMTLVAVDDHVKTGPLQNQCQKFSISRQSDIQKRYEDHKVECH